MKSEQIQSGPIAMPEADPHMPREVVRKSFLAVLSAILAVICACLAAALIEAKSVPKPLPQPNASDLDSNGYIWSGYMCSVNDADPGKCPVGAYGYANSRLEILSSREDLLDEKGHSKEKVTNPNDISQIRGINPKVKIALIPEISGYEFMILSSRRLTKEEKDRVNAYAGVEIQEAVAKWNSRPSHQNEPAWIP